MEKNFLVLLRRKMTQGDICRKLDMDRSYMSAIENGKKNITISQLERLAQALGVSVDKLLK
jgi:transcriptional regulator with XRE-family HTH domain